MIPSEAIPLIDGLMKKFPPEFSLEAKQALGDFLEFSASTTKCEGKSPWNAGEAMAFVAGYIAGRAKTVIQSN